MAKVVRIIASRLENNIRYCKNKLHKVIRPNEKDKTIHDFFEVFGDDVLPSLVFREAKDEYTNSENGNSYSKSIKDFFFKYYEKEVSTFILGADDVIFRLSSWDGMYALCVVSTYGEGDKGICVRLEDNIFYGSYVSFYEHQF